MNRKYVWKLLVRVHYETSIYTGTYWLCSSDATVDGLSGSVCAGLGFTKGQIVEIISAERIGAENVVLSV